jgi:hypothetical protein
MDFAPATAANKHNLIWSSQDDASIYKTERKEAIDNSWSKTKQGYYITPTTTTLTRGIQYL